jgi:ABC-type transport system involved in cytochrome bd biosynthesis fused ATPase/permease subunit
VLAVRHHPHLLDWIATLPAGWDTLDGEHGAQISGRQRRRLALAGALLADFPVLVVDEPTEALDDATAAAVMGEIVDAGAGRARLVISHRAADVALMRDVYTMHHGIVTQKQPSDRG